jgi:hypothetical protein
MEGFEITEAMKKRNHAAANRTWKANGGMILENENEKPDRFQVMTIDDVVDIVIQNISKYGKDKEAIETYNSLKTVEEQMEALKAAFPEKIHGW